MKLSRNISGLNKDVCLIIGMVDSPHLQSWITGTVEAKVFKKIIIFPSDFPKINKYSRLKDAKDETRVSIFRLIPSKLLNFYFMHLLEIVFGNAWRSFFIRLILEIKKPQVLHYHEMQHGGYLLNRLSEKIISLKKQNLVIIGSTWGSDLTFFGYVETHSEQIQNLLNLTSILTAERTDEIYTVRKFTYEGKFVAPVYISVGNKIESESRMTSADLRKTILVRGYQHDQGRALNALKSLEEIEEIKGFEVKIFSAIKSPTVILQAMRMKKSLGIDIQILPKMSHHNFLEVFKESRVYIGLSEADGLSTSMVEAMACGCFPIQSANSAASTFIVDGVNGFIVDPWDIPGIRESIRASLRSDNLVREASALNVEIISRKYNWKTGVQNIKKLYSECILNPEDKTG